jgi:hypothetical protein
MRSYGTGHAGDENCSRFAAVWMFGMFVGLIVAFIVAFFGDHLPRAADR